MDAKDQLIKECLRYDPETGKIFWAKNRRRVMAGDEAGTPHVTGYVLIRVGQRSYRSHRIAWFLHHGRWPEKEIDHINGIKDDNRLCNLREVTHQENTRNSRRFRETGKLPGTFKRMTKDGPVWEGKRQRNGQYIYLGRFKTEREAHEAYLRKCEEEDG